MEMLSFRDSLDLCDSGYNETPLSSVRTEIMEDLKTVADNTNKLQEKILASLNNHKDYSNLKGDIEGRIAQMKNHLDIIEIPGVSLGARKDRYEVRLSSHVYIIYSE